ncbi:MAG: PEGA domain-containing protein, partial [Candidatus Eisenbacteria sp.]|nr:PEGA domain-containing protein [Candidatus Eisenbacteria bacterium]
GIGFLGLKGLLPFSVTQHGEQTSTTDAPLDPQHDNQTTAHQAIPSDPVGDVGGGGDLAEIADRQQPEAQEPAVQPIVDGTLSVDSNPTDASVRMGGRSIGRTPLRRQPVSPGDQRIVIEKLGYEAEVRDIEILSSQDTHLSIDLKALTYSLTVITQPDVAEVLLNGERVGTSPCTFDDLRAGRYPIAIRKQGYDAVQETMQIGLGGQTRFEVVLELQTSQLTIQIIPSGLIYVDSDRKTGDTNATYVTTVVPGSYEITAVHLSWGRWVKRIEVLPDENRELIFDFSREIPVTVVSTPPNAAIIVNGRPTGRYTPSVLHMRPGQKDIEVARNGYRSREGVQELTLEAPLSGPIKFELVKMP